MRIRFGICVFFLMGTSACGLSSRSLDKTDAGASITEAAWIRDGEALEMENESWYPTDEVENLLENEVYMLGKYRNVPVYIERVDVKPYARLYTRFSKNRYRAFESHQ
jgi:hypothetical protein